MQHNFQEFFGEILKNADTSAYKADLFAKKNLRKWDFSRPRAVVLAEIIAGLGGGFRPLSSLKQTCFFRPPPNRHSTRVRCGFCLVFALFPACSAKDYAPTWRGRYILPSEHCIIVMLLSTLATLGAIGSTIAGAFTSAAKNRAAEAALDENHRNTDRILQSRLRSDYTTRSDFQYMMEKQRQLLDAQYKREKGVAAVAGGNNQAVAAQKMANAAAVADTSARLGAQASAYKDAANNALIAENQRYSTNKANLAFARAESIANAAGQAVNAFGNLAAAGGDVEIGKPKAESMTQAQQVQQARQILGAPLPKPAHNDKLYDVATLKMFGLKR